MNATVRETAALSAGALDTLVADAAASYKRLPRALREAHPLAVRRALVIAQGNVRRLVAEPDGSVTVVNNPW